MDGLLPNSILEFNPNQMVEVRKLYGYDDLNRLRQDIKLLQHWIQKQEHFLVKDYDEAYLERHLICSKGSIERAKKRLDKLCTLRGLMPEYLRGLDIENEFHIALKSAYMCVLPKPTPDNNRVFYFEIHNPDASLFETNYTVRCTLLGGWAYPYLGLSITYNEDRTSLKVMQYICSYDYTAGIEVLCDTKNFSLGIVSKISPMAATNTFMLISEALGLRVKGLHYVSGSKAIEIIVSLLKQCLSTKLASRLHVHNSFESVYEYIPKEILPAELGGILPFTIKDITESNLKEFVSPEFIKTIKYQDSAVTEESKRLSSKFNEDYSGMPGSFKVLSVD